MAQRGLRVSPLINVSLMLDTFFSSSGLDYRARHYFTHQLICRGQLNAQKCFLVDDAGQRVVMRVRVI